MKLTLLRVWGWVKRLAAKVWGALDLSDMLVVGGAAAAITGTVQLFGWSVALLVFGLAAMAAGVALVIAEARRGAK